MAIRATAMGAGLFVLGVLLAGYTWFKEIARFNEVEEQWGPDAALLDSMNAVWANFFTILVGIGLAIIGLAIVTRRPLKHVYAGWNRQYNKFVEQQQQS